MAGSPKQRRWTQAETDYLIKHHATMHTRAIAIHLGRSTNGVRCRLYALQAQGICGEAYDGKHRPNKRFSDAEIEYIREHYQTTRVEDMAIHLGRSVAGVRIMRNRLDPEYRHPRQKAIRNAPTLCWGCQRAVGPDMCLWAMCLLPVLGWTAIPTEPEQGKHSYCVTACPLHLRDNPRK